jgi:hypothetical protein
MEFRKQDFSMSSLGGKCPKCAYFSSNFLSISDLHLNNNNNNHGCGVHTLVRLAEGKEYENVSGKYFDAHGKQIRPAAEATDERVQNRLWELSKEICGRFLKN